MALIRNPVETMALTDGEPTHLAEAPNILASHTHHPIGIEDPPVRPGPVPEPRTSRVAHRPISKRRRVLVVDDNTDLAQSLARLLQLLGHEARVADDGFAALELAVSFVPDLALVDIGLPGISGYDVARLIRERPELEHIVLVAQTGWGQEEDRRRSREAGFDHHLVKPLELVVLQDLLAALPEDE